MSRRLPPLNAVRAFEAAARHNSFRLAAEELHVTPGAISQQVKQLEEWIGVPLFRRLPRGLAPTEAGSLYGPLLGEMLDGIAVATRRLAEQAGHRVLTVSTIPSFGTRWLVPRLGSLRRRCPALEVRVQINQFITDFQREAVDVAIRHGGGNYPGLRSDHLFDDVLFPVCAPRLVEDGPPLRRPCDLAGYTLLHDEPDYGGFREIGWSDWLAAAGCADMVPQRGLSFSFTHMTVQAALAGQGIALAPNSQVAEDLAEGRLVRLFEVAVADPHAYWLVCPLDRADRPDIADFRDWLLDEVRGKSLGSSH